VDVREIIRPIPATQEYDVVNSRLDELKQLSGDGVAGGVDDIDILIHGLTDSYGKNFVPESG
jgi:hypothetical protein